MSNKIAIIGHGDLGITSAVVSRLQAQNKDVVIITPETKKEDLQGQFDNPPYIIRNHHLPEITSLGNGFKCKGKHQYREVKGVWICECGRKIND